MRKHCQHIITTKKSKNIFQSMWSSETKLSCIKTELKRCTMTESLWNRYDISRKSPEVTVILLLLSLLSPLLILIMIQEINV